MIPIVIFVYNRPKETEGLLRSLKLNLALGDRDVYIFQDGLKNDSHQEGWGRVNEIVQKWNFSNKKHRISEENKGLANSLYQGISYVLERYESVIILEDDLILSKDFIAYMDQALETYKENKKISSISGFSHFNNEITEDYFLFPRVNSWGWGTWRDRWIGFKLNNINSSVLKNSTELERFNLGGEDLSWMLRNQLKGKIDSWAIQFTYFQFLRDCYTLFPRRSKVINNGFSNDATHTSKRGMMEMGSITEGITYLSHSIAPNDFVIQRYRKSYNLGKITKLKSFLMLKFGLFI